MEARPAHWYHLWVGDDYHGSAWLPAAEEHFGALINAEFDGVVYVGIVGGPEQRRECESWLCGWWPDAVLAVEADEGFEQVTIDVMHRWCKGVSAGMPVYYAHTKGALHNGPMNRDWRTAMDEKLLGGWRECVKSLHTHDSVGCHWLTNAQFPQNIDPQAPMWGGNFWWANAGYLAKLDRVRGTAEFPPVNRWCAEGWMGRGFPKVLDLKPGWPLYPQALTWA
jgi:hypothetical protein